MTHDISTKRRLLPGAMLLAVMGGCISLSGCVLFEKESAEHTSVGEVVADRYFHAIVKDARSAAAEKAAHDASQAAINDGIQQGIINQTTAPPISEM